MTVIAPSDANRFSMHGAEFLGLASPSRGTKENAVWRVRLPPATPGVSHRLTREEIFVALQGSAEVTLAGARFAFPAGAALIVPADTDFALTTPEGEAFEAIVILPVGGAAQIGDGEPFTPPWAL